MLILSEIIYLGAVVVLVSPIAAVLLLLQRYLMCLVYRIRWRLNSEMVVIANTSLGRACLRLPKADPDDYFLRFYPNTVVGIVYARVPRTKVTD